jgi:hypothetical protein
MAEDESWASTKTGRSKFTGQQAAREPLYEAHVFLIAEPRQKDELRRTLRQYGFRLSSRPKMTREGMLDLLATKNGDDLACITSELRDIADMLTNADYCVYRIRLEQMIFDESDRFARPRIR